ALQGHLPAFETRFVIAAGARVLAFVAETRRFARTAADAAADALLRVFGARARLDGVQLHLALALHEITDFVDHPANGRRIDELARMIDAAQAQPAYRGAMRGYGPGQASDR